MFQFLQNFKFRKDFSFAKFSFSSNQNSTISKRNSDIFKCKYNSKLDSFKIDC